MNKSESNNVNSYLSIKRIAFISLAITIGFYVLFILKHYFRRHMLIAEEPVEYRTPYWIVLLVNVVFSFIMAFLLFLYERKVLGYPFKLKRDELTANIVGSLFVGLAISTVITLMNHCLWPLPHRQHTLFHSICIGWMGDLPLVVIPVMIGYLLRSMHLEQVTAVENETLRAESITSRYEALKNQLDPHFLFNSMNTLQSLITIDTERAEEYMQQLCSVLRYTLQKKEVVTLAEELDCTADYCRMLKIRYGGNLAFDHHINHERYDSFLVPPLAIQGLVENAIKHNVVSAKQPLTVHISTDDDNHLIVSNKIQPKIMETESNGIGLANLTERYRLQWDKKVEIFNDGNNFVVTLPLIDNQK
jgi:fluoride ion exporter CrcB/FEX